MSSKRNTVSPNKSYRSARSVGDGKNHYPLRRELVKRFISYFQILEEEEVGMANKNQPLNTEDNYQKFRTDLNSWDTKLAYGAKCEELKALMKVELQNVYDGEKLDEDEEDYDRATIGYPTFMKSMAAEELDRVNVAPNMTYSVMAGPALWRREYTQILENLIEGKETQADLDKMNNMLFTIYYKKLPKNEFDAIGHDFHKRMAKEIRRRQYDIQIREKSRSRSPRRRPPGTIMEPVPEPQRTKDGISDLINQNQVSHTALKNYYSPNTERPKANVVITDKDDWPKASDFSKVDTDKKYDVNEDPAFATHTGTGVPVRVQRAPNAEDLTEEDLYEELLNERWQRRVRAVRGKIKNFISEDGVTKEMVEDCLDANGKQYLRPITGNLKRKNHPNVVPSVFLMMEEMTDETDAPVKRSLDGWVKWSDPWNCVVEYKIDELGNTKIREVRGPMIQDYEMYPKGDGINPKTNFYVAEERNDPSGNIIRRKINGQVKVTTVNGKLRLAEVIKNPEGIVRREIKGMLKVINGKRSWYEETADVKTGKVTRRNIRGRIRRTRDKNNLDRLVEEYIDPTGKKYQKWIVGILKEDSGLEVISAEVLWNNEGKKELVLICLRGGEHETIKIDKAGAVLDGGGKDLLEEYFDSEGERRIRRIVGTIRLIGKTNADLRLVEETKNDDGNLCWRVIEGVVRPIDERNAYVMDLVRQERLRQEKRISQSIRQRYNHPEGFVVERRIAGTLVRKAGDDGESLWFQEVKGELKQILGQIVGVNLEPEVLDTGLMEEYMEDGAYVTRAIRGELLVRQLEDASTELQEYRDGNLWEIIRGRVRNFGSEKGSKMVLVDEYTNDKGDLIRREINGKLEEVRDEKTGIHRIAERHSDLDGNDILLQIKGQIKLTKVYEFLRDEDGKHRELSVYDYQDGRQKFQGVLGRVRCVNLGEGRGIELVEECKIDDGRTVFRVLNELDMSNPAWFRHAGIEDQMSPAKIKSKSGKFIKQSGSPERAHYTDGDKKDGFFEECTNDKGEKERIRMKGILKVGISDGQRVLVEEGLDKKGNFMARPVYGDICNPNCTTLNPGLLEIYQSPKNDEMSRYIVGELKILNMNNGRFLVEQKKEYDVGVHVGYTLRRIIEGYIHSNDRCENRAVIVERVKDKNGYTNSKRVYGCLRNNYAENEGAVIEEYLDRRKKDQVQRRFITGYLMICRMLDLPIELKDKNINVEVFTSNKEAKALLHSHLDTLNALGRFSMDLTEKVKASPKTFLKGSGRSPPKISESEVRVIDKKTDHFIHYDEENIEFGNEPSPKPQKLEVIDDDGVEYNPDVVLNTVVTQPDEDHGQHKNMIGSFMMQLRKPAVTKTEEKTKKKDEKLIETYLARMKLPALNPEQEESKRRDEEILARYLNEANTAQTPEENEQRKRDAEMLISHFAKFNMNFADRDEKENYDDQDVKNIALFLENTKPTVIEEFEQEKFDHALLAKWALHIPNDKNVPETVRKEDEKREGLISKYLIKAKVPPKSEEDTRQRNRDNDLMARFLAQKKIEPKTQAEREQRRRDEEWVTTYINRMGKKNATPESKEKSRKDNEWMARFMMRTRPELEEAKDSEDTRVKDEKVILSMFTNLASAGKEAPISEKERKNDAALLARFLRPKPKVETEEEAEKVHHEYEILQDFLMHHKPMVVDHDEAIEIHVDEKPKQKTPDINAEKDAVANYLKSMGLKKSETFEQGFVTRDEPKIENFVVGDKYKKVGLGLHGLIKPEKPKVVKPATIIQSEVIVDNGIKIKLASPKRDLLAELREEEDKAARLIQRAWRRYKLQRYKLGWGSLSSGKNVMPRDKFIDLYVRFMQFLETLPNDYKTEDLFKVFMFYLDESREGRWSQMKTYTESERTTYLNEQRELFYKNQAEGKKRSTTFKKVEYKF